MPPTPTIDWLTIIQTIGSILIGIGGLVFAYLTNVSASNERRQYDERNNLTNKLNTFYGPFRYLLGVSYRLHQILQTGKGEDFRTLIWLLDGHKFTGNDKELIDEIIRVEERLENLIMEHSGLVSDQKLLSLFSEAGTHIRLLRMAYKGQIKGDVEKYKEYVYPRNLDVEIENQIRLLNIELESLSKR